MTNEKRKPNPTRKRKRTSPASTSASKSKMAALKKTAEEASTQLDREQEESVMGLATALGEIGEGEAVAEVEARVDFLESQVERLLARRQEADRGIESDFQVMRARIDEALEAVGATAVEQRDAGLALDKRLSSMISHGERQTTEVVDRLRTELVSKVQEAIRKLETSEARLRGETRALEEEIEERFRGVSETNAESQDSSQEIQIAFRSLADQTRESNETLLAQVDSQVAQVARDTAERATVVSKELQDLRDASASLKDLDELRRHNSELTVGVSEMQSKILTLSESDLPGLRDQLSDFADSLRTASDKRLGEMARELEAGLNEARVEFRMQLDSLKERLNNSASDEKLAEMNREIDAKTRDFEERVTLKTQRIESLIARHSDQLAGDEQEWLDSQREISQTLGDLKARVEELSGRVSSTEARRATERGASDVAAQGLASRLDVLEVRIREAVEQMSSAHATRLEMVESRVESLAGADTEVEEKMGAVDYLSRRVGDLAERLDEVLTRVNAVGRYVTRHPDAVAHLDGLEGEIEAWDISKVEGQLDELVARVSDIERASQSATANDELATIRANLASLAQGLDDLAATPDVADVLGARLADVERKLTESGQSEMDDPSPRIESIERRLKDYAQAISNLSASVEENLESHDPGEISQRLGEVEKMTSSFDSMVQRLQALGERIDSLPSGDVTQKLSAIEEAMTALGAEPGISPEVADRLATLEEQVSRLAKEPTGEDDLILRLHGLEQQTAELREALNDQPTAQPIEQPSQEAQPPTEVAEKLAELIEKVEKLELKVAVSPTTILPSKKKRRVF